MGNQSAAVSRSRAGLCERVPVATSATIATIVAIAMPGPRPALAQAADRDAPIVEEIVVTAQKREQTLQEVPFSISAITGQTLDDSGLSGIQDLSQMAPGLLFAETIGRQTASPSIRGVTPFGFADPTVQVLIDGYTNGFTRSGNNALLMNLQRIEILRGPQATLYGRNAIGGVINYITRKPDNEARATLLAEAGTRESYLLQGAVSGPLVQDVFFAGLALGYRDFGGFMDNTVTGNDDVNDEQDINARLSLRYTPTDALELNFTLDYNEADDAAGDPSHVPPEFFSANPPSLADVAAGGFDFNDFARTVSQDTLGGFDRDEATAVLNVTYDLGWGELESITGISDQETDVATDVTRTPGPSFFGEFFDVIIDNMSWSEELRLVSTGEGPLTWLAGLYYFENQRDRLLTFDGGPPIQNTTVEIENAAVFANLEYRFSERWALTAGLRFDREERTDTQNFSGVVREADFDELLPTLTLSFQPSDALHVYGTISRGYHAGGPNTAASVQAGAPNSFEPEFVTNFELGAKGTSGGGRFSYEAAAFFMDWTDQQIQTSLTPLVGFISNAGESEVKGLEFAGRYTPAAGLDFSLSFSILDTEYTDYVDPINTAPFGLDPQLAGNELVYAADFSGSFMAQYLRPVAAGGWDLRLRGEVNHVGERAFDVTNLLVADAYTVVNLYAGVQNERYELGLFVDNTFDEEYLNGGFLPSLFFPPLLTVGDPRIYGVRARFRL